MTELFTYFLKGSIILTFFYGFYYLLLQDKNRHTWNRYFLLATLFLSVIIPLLEVPDVMGVNSLMSRGSSSMNSSSFDWGLNPMEQALPDITQKSNPSGLLSFKILLWLYLIVTGFFLVRFAIHLTVIQKLRAKSQRVYSKTFNLYSIKRTKPFSFFNSIFIPEKLFQSTALNEIIAHEHAHVRQFHSVDRLIIDLYISIFWFNPFSYLYRKVLIEVHEYQADHAVVSKTKNPLTYQEALYQQLTAASYSSLVSHFNFSLIKKRIIMINQNKPKSNIAYHLLAIPLILLLIFGFSSTSKSSYRETIVTYEPLSEQRTASNSIPGILPLDGKKVKRLSSGFGERFDPFTKQYKMHSGVDFAAPTGTEVYSTADGTVIEAGIKSESLGKFIVVDHGVYQTRYHHLSKIDVKEGMSVLQGDLIGAVGNTGKSTASHLHYEVHKNNVRQNPDQYLGDAFLETGK